MILAIDHQVVKELKFPEFSVKLSDTPTQLKKHPPLLGEHTGEILRDLRYSDEEIQKLINEKIV